MEFTEVLHQEWKQEITRIEATIASGGTLSVIGIYGIGKSFLYDYLKTSTKNIIAISLKDLPNPSVKDVYQIVTKQLVVQGLVSYGHNIPETDFSFHYLLRDAVVKHGPLTLLVYEAERLVSLSEGFFDALTSLVYYTKPSCSIIFLGQPQLLTHGNKGMHRLIQSHLFLRAWHTPTVRAYITSQEERYHTSFSPYIRAIIRYCGGHYGTMNYLLQKVNTNQPHTLSPAVFRSWIEHDSMMDVWVRNVRMSLPSKSQSVIQYYVTYKRIPQQYIDTSEFAFLSDLGIFRLHGSSYHFLFEYFCAFLKQHYEAQPIKHDHLSVSFQNGTLMIGGSPARAILSPQEEQIMQVVYRKRGHIISYDQFGKILWPDDEDAFSLWAIHKCMSRIRKKLILHGIYTPALQSIRNKGYLLR